MQCVCDLHKEQEQGTEVVYIGKKTHNSLWGLWSYPSDWVVKWHRINLNIVFWVPSLIHEFLYITYYCIFMLHMSVYFTFLIVTLSEHALVDVGENPHFSIVCIGKSSCTLKSAALHVAIALKCSLPFCRWPGGLHGPRLLLAATVPR